jgi:hypothetical protein
MIIISNNNNNKNNNNNHHNHIDVGNDDDAVPTIAKWMVIKKVSC